MKLTNSRQGADISFNFIIIAVIAVVILIVLIFIFAGKASIFGKDITSCEAKGGICANSADQCLTLFDPGRVPLFKTNCNTDEATDLNVCCIPT